MSEKTKEELIEEFNKTRARYLELVVEKDSLIYHPDASLKFIKEKIDIVKANNNLLEMANKFDREVIRDD